MTPEESEQIALIGSTYLWNNCSLIFASGLTGVYLLAFAISIHIHLQKRNTGRAHKAMTLLLSMGCGLAVLDICCDSIACFVLVYYGLVVPLPGGLESQQISASLHAAAINITSDVSASLMFLTADTIIVWRAWAIWAESRIIRSCLAVLILVELGISIPYLIADSKIIGNQTSIWDWIIATMNLAVNTISTLLIVYRAWAHHNSMRAFSHNRKTQVQAILLLFIESGAVLAVVQVLDIVLQALSASAMTDSPAINIGTFFLSSLYMITSALNPVAIVILVHTENTYEHSFHLDDVSSLPLQSTTVADGLLETD